MNALDGDAVGPSRPRPAWRYARRAAFYVGFLLSPLTPGNDALVNQLPSALLAGLVAHGRTGATFSEWYITFYIASNVLGILLMLTSLPELRRRWSDLRRLFLTDRKRFGRIVLVDVLTFAAFLVAGLVVSRALL
ncbi:MAG TPA: hypothetical protein VH561_02940 [Micromonosporaceae bacterium]